uniref:RILP-like protein 1 n=1 Tax=Esox lucius TaxID=8010 RepID=A0A3P9A520_ESOLU
MDDMRIVLDKNATELTVMDVYDIAAVMGLEFEHIADQFGCEALLRLMPKVVRVLEMLEVLVARNNNSETEELRRDLDMLRLERKDRLEKEKIRLRELELVEDVWRGEAQDRLSQITQLEVENKRLQKSLSLKDSHVTEEELQRKEGVSEREHQVMMKLKDMVDKQRGDIQEKDHELNLKNEDLKALQLQHHCLRKINLELRHRVRMMDAQCKTVIQQKAEVEAMSQGRQQELEALRQEVARLKEERQHWKLKRAEEEVREVPDALELKEDDSPRFTLQELQDVLQERNELKAQVFMLQEELIYYKSEELEDEINGVCCDSPHESEPSTTEEPASRIKHLIFTAVMPMVAAGLIADDPTLQPIRRFMSFV